MNLTLRYGIAAGCAALMFTACPGPKPGETDSGDESSGDMTAGVSTTSGGATTGENPTTDAMSGGTQGGTGGTSTDGMSTTGQTTAMTTVDTATSATSEGTTGEPPPPPPELVDACNAACDKFLECIMPAPFPDKETCVQGCLEEPNGEPACVEANIAFDQCLAGLDCPALQEVFQNEDFGTCNDEFATMDMACQTCESFAGVGEPDGCSLGKSCPNMPTVEISCMGDTCTCLVDDVEMGTCPANGICAAPDGALQMLAKDCCGFDL